MSRLILVRHGQASAFTDDYDRLSDLGRKQSGFLGKWWIERGLEISRVYSGPLNRQRDTAEIVAGTIRRGGKEMPDPIVLEGLREIEADRIMAHLQAVREEHPKLDRLIRAYGAAGDREEKGSIFQEYFEEGMLLWAEGRVDSRGIESLSAFQARILESLKSILAGLSGGEDIAVFSSAGPVTIITGHLLGLDNFRTLELTFRLKNCSVTEFALTGRGPVLQQFNCTGHLPPEMVTIR